MAELENAQAAKDSFNFLYDSKSAYAEDYAKIAWLLTDEDRFSYWLDQVSLKLWQSYSRLPSNIANKFFQALRFVAKDHGFYFDSDKQSVTDLVTLYAAIPAEDYLRWISQGVFFKDEMDVKHGEHSHSFQWLAIAMWGVNNLTHPAAELYRNIYKVRPSGKPIIVPGIKLKPKNAAIDGPRKDVSLWSWLVDCFPTEFAHNQAAPDDHSLFSNSFRSPQRVTHYLMNEKSEDTHFLTCYLKSRYLSKGWFKQDYVDPHSKGKGVKIFPDYEHIGGGATSKNLAHKKKGNDLWNAIGPSDNPCGYVRQSNDARGRLSDVVSEDKRRIRVDRNFHGHAGKMIVHYDRIE